jgi:3-dehydroquinate dehydratase-2
MRVLLLNGPNLNLLGHREPGLYGASTLAEIEAALGTQAQGLGAELSCFQSNHEGALVDRIQAASGHCDGILINAGAYTHTSVALRDALLGVAIPFVELHLSNVHSRESFRHHSFLADRAIGVICGFGPASYGLALEGLLGYLRHQASQASAASQAP